MKKNRFFSHNIRLKDAKDIIIVLTLIFTVGLIITSLLFNKTYVFMKNTFNILEKELGVELTWDAVELSLLEGSINFHNIQFLDIKEYKPIIAFGNLKIGLKTKKILEYVISEIKEKRFVTGKIPRYMVKFLSYTNLEQSKLNYTVETDTVFISNLFRLLFLFEQVPNNFSLYFNNINGWVSLGSSKANVSDSFVVTNVSNKKTGRLKIDIYANTEIVSWGPDIKTLVKATISSKEDLDILYINGSLSNLMVKDIIGVKPIDFSLVKEKDSIDFSVFTSKDDINLNGSFQFTESSLSIGFDTNKFTLGSLFNIKDEKKNWILCRGFLYNKRKTFIFFE